MALSIQATANELIQYVQQGFWDAAADGRHPWRLPVLITANEGRIVVLRGIDAERGSWMFFTDVRTPKAEQIRAKKGQVAATVYHPVDRSQVRLKGITTLLAHDKRRSLWEKLSISQKSSYGASVSPGTELEAAGDGLSETWTKGNPSKAELDEAFVNFGAYTFEISEVELLVLHSEGHRRCRWEGWKGDNFKWLVP
ncbi:MAG: hypothetical protein AB8F78_11595 [Saprospiraceae bacterium]